MSTPTPAPALTDEQIEEFTEMLRRDYIDAVDEGFGEYAGLDDEEPNPDIEFDTWYAAVVARAKREAAEEIARFADEGRDAAGTPEQARAAYREMAACARQIGATR